MQKNKSDMKIILKSLIIISISICFSINCFSNTDAQKSNNLIINSAEANDSLKAQIIKLEKLIEHGSYIRIPNKDFENIIDNKIQKSMRETVNWWLIVIAMLISILGFLVSKYAKTYLRTIVEGKVNQLKKENEEKIKSISNDYFSTAIDGLLDFKIETIEKKEFKVEEHIVDDLKKYLTVESITITEHKKIYLIDTIMSCYFSNNFPEKRKKMVDLIEEYEEKFTLFASTYFNAAIAFSEMYENYGGKEFFNSAVENCNKSIKILPDYGTAFAQKLELYIMGISKAFDNTEKKQFESGLLKVFKDIENNKSPYLCKELIDRFEDDKESFMKPYLKKLYKQYSDEMAKIKVRATSVQPPINPHDNPINS